MTPTRKPEKKCRRCGGPVPTRRHNWCGPACIHAHKLENWPRYWRDHVLKRDGYICQRCGVDGKLRELHGPARLARIAELTAMGYDVLRALVEAHHIIARCEGGPNTLENGTTLCQLCHKAETKALAARRAGGAKKRRAKKG